jgi:hypothetical protein
MTRRMDIAMVRVIEKIADRPARWAGANIAEIVCHRCGTQCVLPAGMRLEEALCVGCVQRLGNADRRTDARPPAAARTLADWADKAAVSGPGYGLVTCPHCDADCVVAVGEVARTGCGVCLRPLGTIPLVRVDLTARAQVAAASAVSEEDQLLGRCALRWPPVAEGGLFADEWQ